jgi:hypothetical protein
MYRKQLAFGNSNSKIGLSSITKLKKNQIIKEEDNEDETDVVQHSKYTHSTSKEVDNKTKQRRTKSTKKFKDLSA